MVIKEKTEKKTKVSKDRYVEAVGRRKTSIARVRLTPASKNTFKINDDRDLATYFPTEELRRIVEEAVEKAKIGTFDISIHIKGGGIHSQAEAVRHGIARVFVKIDEALKPKLKTAGFLKRDPRAKERRKFGLKKARKSAQWSKR